MTALLLCPALLSAQSGNGIVIDDFAVSAGTVTFNVSWKKANMPALWSDTVWVLVDYFDGSAMTRLPITGAQVSAGRAIMISGNDRGAWVVGNARSAGTFSTTVRLFYSTQLDVAGACAYASNYPPQGTYASAGELVFIGTPPYHIVTQAAAGAPETWDAGSTFSVPTGAAVTSFTDATAAPGGCIPMLGTFGFTTTTTSIPSAELLMFTAEADVQAPAAFAVTYQWSAPDLGLVSASGPSFTFSPSPSGSGPVVPVTLTAKAAGHCDKVVEQQVCLGGTPPGSTVTFDAFTPCPVAPIGSVWYLTDTRESTNEQTYKVKKLADGHIWMVQDLKFGNLCGTAFSGSSATDQTGHVSNTGTYYGDCTAATNTSTPANRGYLYDWAAAINKAGAYYGSNTNVGCSGTVTGTAGTAPGACQGICPAGWHIPTGATSGEYSALHNALGGCSELKDGCWNAASAWEGVLGGYCSSSGSLNHQGSYANYWSSTYYYSSSAYYLYFYSGYVLPGTATANKYYGFLVRCVRNY